MSRIVMGDSAKKENDSIRFSALSEPLSTVHTGVSGFDLKLLDQAMES